MNYNKLEGDAERTLVNALDHGITVNDSSHISLGEDLKLPVYTADRRLKGKVESESLFHVSEYKARG
jgi:predicted nucleic acid-binding protein